MIVQANLHWSVFTILMYNLEGSVLILFNILLILSSPASINASVGLPEISQRQASFIRTQSCQPLSDIELRAIKVFPMP